MWNSSNPMVRMGWCVLLFAAAMSAKAADHSAVVGQAKADGTVALYLDRFQERLDDGTQISNVAVTTIDGYLHVTRRSHLANGGCNWQAVKLSNRAGQAVLAGSTSPGQDLLISSDFQMIWRKCLDDGCAGTVGIGPVGGIPPTVQPEIVSASCDITEASDNKCACHQTLKNQSNRISPPGVLCKALSISLTTLDLSRWIRLSFIQSN